MRKEDKSTVIEQIASTLKEYSHFYLAETAALNARKQALFVVNASSKI